MTVREAIAEIRKTGTLQAENGKLKLRFPEPERGRLGPAIEVLRRDREAVLRALMGAEIQHPLEAPEPARQEGGEIALRWYCATCGTNGVIWHGPKVTCDAKERAILRAHSERASGCRRLDYRVVSDSETRPRRAAA
jgi:hypothetical protein